MLVHELKLTHFRGLLNTEIKFQPGFNLIVGVNGAGKSSVLDALRVLLSHVLPMFASAPHFNLGFEVDDIMLGRASMQAELTFSVHGSAPYTYVVHKNREQHVQNAAGGLREQTTETQDKRGLLSTDLSSGAFSSSPREFKKCPSQPLVLYFSVDRSRATDEVSKVGKKANPGYFGSLQQHRGLRVQDLVQWWRVKEQIAQEAPEGTSAKQLLAVRNALERLLLGFSNWRLEAGELWVTKKVVFEIADPESLAGRTRQAVEVRNLRIQQLSDGERSMIAFVFDLTRRLAQLNESDSDPAANGLGVVLIDEIDLHLHPAWQRRIAIDLPRVFPSLQFIATTHSPQIIGETEPGRAIILREGGQVQVLEESLGRDSGWILRHVMDTPERNAELQTGLDEIDQLIDDDNFQAARKKVGSLRSRFGN
ncbi:MAG: AAA family ATPase, partial [Burkholderiaceae bacterium]